MKLQHCRMTSSVDKVGEVPFGGCGLGGEVPLVGEVPFGGGTLWWPLNGGGTLWWGRCPMAQL